MPYLIIVIVVYSVISIFAKVITKNINGNQAKKKRDTVISEYQKKIEDDYRKLNQRVKTSVHKPERTHQPYTQTTASDYQRDNPKFEGITRAMPTKDFFRAQENTSTQENRATGKNVGKQTRPAKTAKSAKPAKPAKLSPQQSQMQSSRKTEDKLRLMQDCLVQIQKVLNNYNEDKLNISYIDMEFIKEFKSIKSSDFYYMDRNDLLTYVQKLERFKLKNPTLPDKLMTSLMNFLADVKYIQNDSKVEEETFPEKVIRNNLSRRKNLVQVGNSTVFPLRQSIIWKEILDKPKSMR